MRNLLIIVLLQPIFVQVFSQGYIGISKDKAREWLLKYEKEYNLKTLLLETDSSLTLQIRDSTKRPLDIIVKFGPSGKSISEARVANCDSCFQKYLKSYLEKQNLGWIKIGNGKYVSKYSKKLILESPMDNNPYSFIIRRSSWTRKEYNEMIKQSFAPGL